MADEKLLKQALDALTDLRFVLDCALGINAVRPHEANGPAFKADMAINALRKRLADVPAAPAPKLTVWFGPMPESSGKTNWTAILHRGDMVEGFTIGRSEHHDRVRYDADKVRWLIGETGFEPDILMYDGDMLSPPGYVHPCGVDAVHHQSFCEW